MQTTHRSFVHLPIHVPLCSADSLLESGVLESAVVQQRSRTHSAAVRQPPRVFFINLNSAECHNQRVQLCAMRECGSVSESVYLSLVIGGLENFHSLRIGNGESRTVKCGHVESRMGGRTGADFGVGSPITCDSPCKKKVIGKLETCFGRGCVGIFLPHTSSFQKKT